MDTPNTEPTISELRGMLAPEAPTDPAAPATASPADTPASEPAAEQGKSERTTRDEKGKFKASDSKEITPAESDGLIEATDPAGVQRRIGQALRRQREAEEKLAAALAQKQESRPATETAQTPAATAPEPPKAEDFKSYEDFTRAVSRFEAKQAHAELIEADRQGAEKATARNAEMQRQKDFDAAEVEARKTHADYDDVLATVEWPKTQAMAPIAEYLLETRNASLMYSLVKNPAELKRIASLNPVQAIAALGKFEAGLTAPATPAKRELPRPPRNVGGTATAHTPDLNDPDLDFRSFKTMMRNGLNKAA